MKKSTYDCNEKLNTPLISIIIVVFNGERFIQNAIESVLSQGYSNIELILIDGKSTDRTMNIVQKYEEQISVMVSETDLGIYDAMNKGIKLSRGDWLYFLGSDDTLYSKNTIASVFGNESKIEDYIDIIFGNVVDEEGKLIRSSLNWKTLLHNTLHHQSAFYRSSLFKHFYYRTDLRIISDYELNLISYISGNKHLSTNDIIAVCRNGGISTDHNNHRTFVNETNLIRLKHLPGIAGYILKYLFELKCRIHYAIRHI